MIGVRAPVLFDGEGFHDDQVVLIEGDRILDVTTTVPPDVQLYQQLADTLLVPGFVDLQVNGGGGVMFNDAITPEGLRRIAAAHARAGTTSLLPTLISGRRDQLADAMAAVEQARNQRVPGIVGLHLEGPFLSPARAGIHPKAAILTMTAADVALLSGGASGVLLVTLAPETVESGWIARLAAAGVVVFAGHTDARWEELQPGLRAGLAGFTHLFNAMSPFASRDPGAVGAVFADSDTRAGIIVDGHHSHFASVRAAYRAMGPKRLFLVSDAMATVESDITGFALGGTWIALRDGRLTDETGTLGGAHLTMAAALRNAVDAAGIPLGDALRMATATPAEVIGQRDIGRIAPGCRADLVLLGPDLEVVRVWQGGVATGRPG